MMHEDECRNPNFTSYKEKSLLSKYDIPIENLSYEYIEQCSVAKELERIVKILRSGEEGLFPDLIEKAEARLKLIHPKSRLLTVEQPALTKYTMPQKDWNGAVDDLSVWTDKMKIKDNDLFEASMNQGDGLLVHPPIREMTAKHKFTPSAERETKVQSERIPSCDYKRWDNYDAETEVLKMDLEEEKINLERKKDDQKISEESDTRISELIAQAEKLTDVERQYLAEQEKNRGNEFFNCGDLKEAIKCYTTSIAIFPTSIAYSNRALCYIQQCKFNAVLEDTNKAIELNPENNKAYYRRALAYQHKNEFHKALADMRKVLQKEPNHVLANHIADNLRALIYEMPKKVRLLIKGQNPDGTPENEYVEVSQKEYKTNPMLKNGIEVNHWGIPKNMRKGLQHHSTTSQSKIAQCFAGPNRTLDNKCVKNNTSGPKIIELDRKEVRSDEKCDRPRRLEIIEVDSLEESCDKPKFSIVDKREMNGGANTKGNVSNSQVSKEFWSNNSGARPKTNASGNRYIQSKSLKPTITSTSVDQSVTNVSSSGASVVVANKYKNMIKEFSESENTESRNVASSVMCPSYKKVSPFHFNSIWITRQPDLEKQANVLRSVSPADLPELIGITLDDCMLSAILQCLKNKFDKQQEQDLVRDYLIALTKCKRFSTIVSSFMPLKDAIVVRELVAELKPEERIQITKEFRV